ncbi:MAG: glutathione synthase [Gammaproteobacteria bacterium]|nr:glutathione synthase [Gammaproteobacteria bacterium]
MPLSLGVVMDPIGSIKIHKDSTFAMLLESQRRGWTLWYMQQEDLCLHDGRCHARIRPLQVRDDPGGWFELGDPESAALDDLDVVLMRKDPPFDMEYVHTTYLLEQAEARGTLVVNRPAALRDANEKLFTAWFPTVCAPTLVSRRHAEFSRFVDEHGDAILKPLDGMGGASIFRVRADDPNRNVIIETLTAHQTRYAMAQRFIPEISAGDKRILVIDGEPVPYALARIPTAGETRGNLAAGGRGVGVALSDKDREIVETVAPRLREHGILFAGIDVIGDFLTEVNVTSPTCIRELDKLYGLNISATLMDCIEQKLAV